MKQIGIFPHQITTKQKHKDRAGLMALKSKWSLEHPAGLINLLAHPGCGEDWQPANRSHVPMFYMIKHIGLVLNHPYFV